MKLLKQEKGVAMVIAALSIVTLLLSAAVVIDVGQLYMTKARLQTAADAAAMAGAQSLIDNDQNASRAILDSRAYVNSNLKPPFNYNPEVNPESTQSTFKATVSQTVSFYFMPVVGIRNQLVTASSTAAAQVVTAITGVVPFGVEEQDFIFKKQYILKFGAGPPDNTSPCGCKPQGGNYGALALGRNEKKSGANVYREYIMYGYQGIIRIGDTVWTEPGNMAGPTDQGVSYRKSLCTKGCSIYTQFEANCPRVVIVPIIDEIPTGGRSTAVIRGFAAFFLEDVTDGVSKGQKDVIGRFLKWSATGEGGEGNNFGLVTANLIK
jgi:Flp pilus assembly protein TadG